MSNSFHETCVFVLFAVHFVFVACHINHNDISWSYFFWVSDEKRTLWCIDWNYAFKSCSFYSMSCFFMVTPSYRAVKYKPICWPDSRWTHVCSCLRPGCGPTQTLELGLSRIFYYIPRLNFSHFICHAETSTYIFWAKWTCHYAYPKYFFASIFVSILLHILEWYHGILLCKFKLSVCIWKHYFFIRKEKTSLLLFFFLQLQRQ